MPNNPTVILGSLNDEELKKSIDKLVTHVDTQLDHMVSSAKKAVQDINTVFKNLGDIKVDSTGTSDGGSSRRTKINEKETDSIKEKTAALNQQIEAFHRTAKASKDVATTYDQQAQAMEKAMQPKSARESYLAFQQGFKAQAETLARQIKEAQDALNTAIATKVGEYERKISDAKAKLNDLFVTLAREKEKAQNEGNYSSYNAAITRTQQQIEYTTRHIEELKRKMAEVPATFAGGAQEQAIERLKSEHERISNIMKEEVSAQQQNTEATQNRISREERLTKEIKERADAIRKSKEWQEKGYAFVGGDYYYDKDRALVSKNDKAKLLSLEEQITQKVREQEEAERKVAQAAKEAAEAKKAQVVGTSGQELGWGSVHDMERRSQAIMEQNKKVQEQATSYSSLENVVSQYLGISTQELQIMTQKNGSYNALSASLKNMIAAYQEMSQSERSSATGKNLADNIQRVQKAMHDAQAQMTRPISLEAAMGLSTKSLDDIAYKIRQLQAYRQSIDLTKPNATNEINQVNAAIRALQKDMDSYMGKASGVLKANNALGRSWNYMKNRLAFYFTVGASTAFVKSLIEVRGQYELLERSIGILVDSMQQGTQVFSELNAMAIKSPFTTMELGAAAKQLVAYDVAAKDVVDTTRRLADMAAAVGIPIERLTYALGQIKAYGYLNARDARMFANAGIPLVKELADRYTELEGKLVSTSDVYDRIKKKAISYEDVMETVNKMTDEGGKFFNFQEKAADTLKVKIANLTLAYNNFLNELGKSNQGMITKGLGAVKSILDNWRNIENVMYGVVTAYGAVKAAQVLWMVTAKKASAAKVMLTVLSKGLIRTLIALKASFMALAANPFTWVMAAASAIAYLGWQYHDLQVANEQFNKSIVDNTEENINSINKFFADYKDQLASIGGSDTIEQSKMWERMAEEIEKTTKNAKGYLAALEKISDMPTRIEAGRAVLSQSQEINKEVEKLAKLGKFDMGGGFADSNLANNLKDYEEKLNSLIKDYDTVENAEKKLNSGWSIRWYRFTESLRESARELKSFVSILDDANMENIMGTSKNDAERLANIREYAHIVRDNFLATEEGQKVGAEGRARLNRMLDEWIAKQGIANNLIKDQAFGERKYSAEQIARIEKSRTAWETFFDQLSAKDKEMMDYIVATGQYGSKEFQEIWDKAVNNLEKSSNESYQAIKSHIAELRAQPDIVIRVVYQEEGKKGDAQTQAYTSKFLTPQGKDVLTPDAYKQQLEENTKKYGRFIKKDGEDNVEWEKRLGETYRANEKSIKRLNAQLENKNALSKESREQKEKELSQYKQEQSALEEIKKYEHFNYEKDKKGGQKDPLGDAIKQQIRLINEMRSSYDKLRKAGVEDTEAITVASRGYEKTVSKINSVLKQFGVAQFKPEEFAGKSYKALLESLKVQRDALAGKSSVKTSSLEALDVEIKKLEVDAKAFDLQKVTEGLNKELGKTKEEYELAVEFDAMPELGGMLADMMGLNQEDIHNLPRTYEQVVKKIQEGINKEFKDNDIAASFDLSKNLRESDFQKWADDNARYVSSDLIKALDSLRQYANKIRSDENKKTIEGWKALVEKYGTLQDKIMKIYKKSAKEQQTLAEKFGTEQQKKDIRKLVTDIQLAEEPDEIADLQEKIAELVKKITNENPVALKFATASQNKEEQEVSKTFWEDFKNSDLYTMTFEDMANNSTAAIQTIIDKLNELKDKVKEDPASMKALMKSLEDAEAELRARNPFAAVIKGLKEWKDAAEKAKAAQEKLKNAQKNVDSAQRAYDDSEDLSDEERADANKKLSDAVEEETEAEEENTRAQNKKKKALKEVGKAMSNVGNEISKVGDIVGTIGDIVAAFGNPNEYNETAEAISDLATTMKGAGQAAQGLGQMLSGDWIGGAAGLLSGIFSAISTWFDNSNKRIDQQVKDSELAVKRLENQYKKLQAAVEDAYGTAVYAMERAALENKKLQLEELKRQLRLEQGRRGKDRDAEKIETLKGQIIDLEREIEKASDSWVNDMLGISNVGDAAEQLVSSMIDAFRNGEDYMKTFSESFDEMVENMIMKAIASKVIGEFIETMWNNIKTNAEKRSSKEAQELEEASREYEQAQQEYNNFIANEGYWRHFLGDDQYEKIVRTYEEWVKRAKERREQALKNYEKAITPTPEDVDGMRTEAKEATSVIKEWFDETMKEWGIVFGDKKNLSALKQGIQGITEDTAGALEAYMNGVSQQVYLQSDLLTQILEAILNIGGGRTLPKADWDALELDDTARRAAARISEQGDSFSVLQQIRDAVVGFDHDAQLGTLADILLQLQNNYTLMNTMASLMAGWSTPSGQGIRVQLLS